MEPLLEGTFQKWVNNTGDIISDNDNSIKDLLTKAETLVHFSFSASEGKFLLTDIQGVNFTLTDPEIASMELISEEEPDEINFCIGNMAERGIVTFFENHHCNIYCKTLNLLPGLI